MGRIIHNRTNRKDHLINKQNITQGADQVLTGLRILPEDSSYLYKYVNDFNDVLTLLLHVAEMSRVEQMDGDCNTRTNF